MPLEQQSVIASHQIKRGPTGHRIGQCHQKAQLTDDEVRRMRAAHKPGKVGYETLAKQFNCGVSTARDICTYRTRFDA